MTIQKLMDKIRSTPTMNSSTGCKFWRMFYPRDRYVVDFADDFSAEGWEQFDTDQDAEYFGVWVNPKKLLTLNYSEGDWTLTECPNAEAYNVEIRSLCEYYREGFIAKGIDFPEGIGQPVVVTEYRQDRAKFLIPTI